VQMTNCNLIIKTGIDFYFIFKALASGALEMLAFKEHFKDQEIRN
jgi:hypothetical protein